MEQTSLWRRPIKPTEIIGSLRDSSLHRNPLYLVSALSMLVGCFILNGALDPRPQHLSQILLVLGFLNLYEALVIALGGYLVTRHPSRLSVLDGRLLLLLAVVFLADMTSFIMPSLEAALVLGSAVNGALFLLALVKLYAILRVLDLSYGRWRLHFLRFELLLLFLVPSLLAAVKARDGNLPAWIMASWWACGIVLSLKAFLPGEVTGQAASSERAELVSPAIRWALWRVPFFSLLAHIAAMNWLYGVVPHPCNAAPILLAVTVHRLRDPSTKLRVLLSTPAWAVLFCLHFPSEFSVPALGLSPLRLVLLATSCIHLIGFLKRRELLLFVSAQLCLIAALAGSSVTAIGTRLISIRQALWGAVPNTITQWGVFYVSLAFVLLGAGALWSLRRKNYPT